MLMQRQTRLLIVHLGLQFDLLHADESLLICQIVFDFLCSPKMKIFINLNAFMSPKNQYSVLFDIVNVSSQPKKGGETTQS